MRNRAGLAFVNGHLEIPQKPIWNATNRREYSVSIDFFISWKTGHDLMLFSERGAISVLLNLYYSPSVGKIFAVVRDEDGVITPLSFDLPTPCACNVTFVRSNDISKLYLDGQKKAEVEATLGDFAEPDSALVGNQALYLVKQFRGTIQRCVIYNRALDDVEMAGAQLPMRGAVLWHDYRLGHANDLSGNGNHGIPHNVQFVGVYTKKGLWCPGQDNAYVEIPEAVISGDDDYTVAVEFADIQPGKLFQHGNDLIIELEGETLKASRINSASEQETVAYNLPQFSGMAIARKTGDNLELLWNGIPVGSVMLTGTTLPDTVRQIGNALRGNIKRVIAYQRALDNGEINQLLNRQLPPHPSLYYDFRLGHADDLSGHGRDGILHGELLWI